MREAVIATARAMNALGINRGKSGNVSARWRDRVSTASVTPSGLPYDETPPDDIVAMTIDGGAARRTRAVVGMAIPPRHLPRPRAT